MKLAGSIVIVVAKGTSKVDKIHQQKVNEEVNIEAYHNHVDIENEVRTSEIASSEPVFDVPNEENTLVEPAMEPQNQIRGVGNDTSRTQVQVNLGFESTSPILEPIQYYYHFNYDLIHTCKVVAKHVSNSQLQLETDFLK